MKTTNFKILSIVLFFTFLSVLNVEAQNCFDADFESGTLGGYVAYHGRITNEGVVTFANQEISDTQHRIMSKHDGYDPIAEQLCDYNKNLLVAGSGTGKYTLRLGDEDNGARTSKVVLSFDVTEDVSFFLLKYAIVINDPEHPHEVQPRFELNIKDADGYVLDCGEYKVRAEANIDGFESCDDWRVRPWTTAGFELESYLGQSIFIEIISTDCGYSGHGGYAYIDATCSPLELELESFCPGSGYARYVVTEGFDAYEWNTGETSRFLDIVNPVPGEEYQVTVTSSTGCTLVLRDTLPQFPTLDDLEPSFFDGPDSLSVCYGEEIVYSPTGTNIDEVEAIELGYSSDVFYIFAEESRVINFVTKDNFGCAYDTTQLHITIEYVDVELDVVSACEGIASGEIFIENFGDDSIETAMGVGPFNPIYHYTDLLPGTYEINIKKADLCVVTKQVIVLEVEPPELEGIIVQPATCDLDNGVITMQASSSSFQFSFNESEFSSESSWDSLASGSYEIRFKNSFGCIDEEILNIEAYGPPELIVESIDSAYCSRNNGSILFDAIGGYPPLSYLIAGVEYDVTGSFTDLSAGEYKLVVKDAADCKHVIEASIPSAPFVQIEDLINSPSTCDEDNGSIGISVENDFIPYDVYLNEVETNTHLFEGLAEDLYHVMVVDHNGCKDDRLALVESIPAPRIDSISYEQQMCVNDRVNVLVNASAYNDNLSYSLNENLFSSSSSFSLVPDNYLFSIQDDTGCVVDTTLEFYPEDWFKMANVFSPNDDGEYDEFCFDVKEGVDYVLEFVIFDRWGNKVYDLVQPTRHVEQACWDGKFQNNEVVMGVYVYNIKVQLTDGRLFCKYGDVTVLR